MHLYCFMVQIMILYQKVSYLDALFNRIENDLNDVKVLKIEYIIMYNIIIIL